MLYKKIDSTSVNTISSALNFFETPPTNVSIANSAYRCYLTLNPINSFPFNFKIHPITSFIDLSKCYLQTELKIKKKDADGNIVNLVAADDVSTIQMIGATWIKNLRIVVNGQETFDSNGLYSYKTYLDYELSYPVTVKDSFLTAVGYSRDSADQDSNVGGGYTKRKALFATSKTAQFMHKIDADLFNQDLYLVNNVEIDIEVTPHENKNFLLIMPAANATEYLFEIESCKLFVKTVDLMDGLSLDIARKLESQPARYGLRKTMLKTLAISEGVSEFNNNLFTSEVPRRIVVGLLKRSIYDGHKNHSPFNFKPFNVREISITANGRNYPQVGYNLNFPDGKYVRAYHDMQEYTGHSYSTESNGINMSMYSTGWTIFAFMLTNSMENDPCFELIKDGTVAVNIKFNEVVPAGGLILVAYGESDALLMIDRNRQLTSDMTV